MRQERVAHDWLKMLIGALMVLAIQLFAQTRFFLFGGACTTFPHFYVNQPFYCGY